MQYVFILGLVFACIFFLVMVILSAKTWRWLHVVATLFVFAMAVMYTAFVAISAKTRNEWKKMAQENEQRVMDLEQAIDDLTLGPTDGIRFGDVSIKHLRLMKEREILGRGRVWREIGPATNVAQDWSQVALSTVPRSAADPANYPPNGIEVGSLVYVFAEGRPNYPPEADYLVPRLYIGEFNVTAADDRNVTLKASLLTANQAELNAARDLPLALYELMPQDRHDAFDDLLDMFREPGIESPRDLSNEYLTTRRQFLQNEIFPNIAQIFPDAPNPQQRTAVLAARERFIDRFAFDDLRLETITELMQGDGNRITPPPFTMLPEERWVLLTMQDDLPERLRRVDVDDSAEAGTGLDRGDYDGQGLAIVRSLQQGYLSEVVEGDELIIDAFNAELGYTDDVGNPVTPLLSDPDLAEKETDIFRRTLNDFEYEFHQLALQMKFLDRKLAQVRRDIQFTEQAFNNAQAQITERERMVNDNTDDIQYFQRDLSLVSTHRDQLERAVDGKRREINRLYAATRELARQKAEIEAALKAHIDRKTQEALDGLDNE